MRAVVLHGFGDTDVLSLDDLPVPEPAENEVRIKVAGATVNRTDINARTGLYGLPDPGPLGYGTGADASGVVDAVGPSVSSLHTGDRVIGFSVAPHLKGAQAEYVVLPVEAVSPAPRSVDLVHAATLPLNGLTATQTLEALTLPANAGVTVTGAAGGLGMMLTQVFRNAGHRVVAWVKSEDDADHVREFGADQVITAADQLPAGTSDAVIDAASLSQDTIKLIKDGGTYVTFLGHEPALDRGIGRVFIEVRNNAGQLRRLASAVDDGSVKLPGIIRHPLDDAAAAQQTFEAGHVRDRLVLTP